METLSNETGLSLVEIVTVLAQDNFTDTPKKSDSLAMVAPVMFGIDGVPVIDQASAQTDQDIYKLLEKFVVGSDTNYLCVFTSGWAAPVGASKYDETPPSLHPLRKRVNLACVTARLGGQASAMRMEGNDELVTDDGQARGFLAEAINELFA